MKPTIIAIAAAAVLAATAANAKSNVNVEANKAICQKIAGFDIARIGISDLDKCIETAAAGGATSRECNILLEGAMNLMDVKVRHCMEGMR